MVAEPIKNRRDYCAALRRVEQLMDARPDTDEGNELERLSALVENYEDKNAPIPPPDPTEAIRFRMEQEGFDALFFALPKSPFRSRFRLGPKERAYLAEKTLPVILEHGRQFVRERLAPAEPKNDGRQTPMRGHPIFIAQHATATCCRGCLEKWHRIPRGRELTDKQIEYVIAVLARWLTTQHLTPVADPVVGQFD